mgnify:CR=1 FL=1
MGKTWKELQKEIEDYIVEIWLEEPEELSKLHQGKLENCAGSYGQYFSTIDHACGMVRDFQNHMYKILISFMDTAFTLDACKVLIRNVHPAYIDYLRYSNYLHWGKYDREFLGMLDTFETKEDLIEFYKSYLKFVNKMNAWSYHYFPHEIGAFFRYQRP